MNSVRRFGVFGGTFDPIHIGHLAAAQDAADALQLDRVLFVPNGRPPHKQTAAVSEVQHRVAMVELGVSDNPRFEVSYVEVHRPGMSYMLDTMRVLRRSLGPDTNLQCLIGCDGLGDLHTWHQPETLMREFQLVVMDRPTGRPVRWEDVERHFPEARRAIQVVHVVQLDISAEAIRARVASDRSIRYFVPPAVAEYIERHALYRHTA